MFQGLKEDTYQFFWELAFNNEHEWFEKNRARYLASVSTPLKELAVLLAPAALDVDAEFNVRPAAVVSRIRRDTRFSHDKSMYRDHAWLGYRKPKTYISESFVLYAEFERESYGYGMGMYAPNAEMMRPIRERILAKPTRFLSLVDEPCFREVFTLTGELFKRPRVPDAPKELATYLDRKNISFCFSSPALSNTLRPEIADEIAEAFAVLKPVYRFLMGME